MVELEMASRHMQIYFRLTDVRWVAQSYSRLAQSRAGISAQLSTSLADSSSRDVHVEAWLR